MAIQSFVKIFEKRNNIHFKLSKNQNMNNFEHYLHFLVAKKLYL